jgi:hypothetical protein
MATNDEVFHKYWLEKFGEPDKQALVTSTVGQLYELLLEAFVAGRESAEPVINPEWCENIVTLHRSKPDFWTISELSRLFQLSEEQVRETLNVNRGVETRHLGGDAK